MRPVVAAVTTASEVTRSGVRLLISFALTGQNSFAGSATWNLNPASDDWYTATNWTPNTVPDDPTDIATFDVSNVTAISVANYIDLSEMGFNPGASSFTFNLPAVSLHYYDIVFSGAGIINNSNVMQNFVTNSDGVNTITRLILSGNSTLGDLVTVTNASTPLAQAGGVSRRGATFFRRLRLSRSC